ncbi:hypothetical protein [Bacteroides pyogenes]|uniref:hypothetical protein n=1 Tax=Bacteroides pyogenes TaxID=310300 RepID=UPI00169651DB|nr:hypothetical protein [Proteiniphilum sp.]NLD46074.1 hypothetical protein [Clostridiaceae bacterium]
MGTSNLYKGPKKNILLPSDYNPDEIPELDNSPENVPEQELPSDNPEENEPSESPIQPVTWGTVRSSISKAMNNRNGRNVKSAIRNYTKALGGHTNATRQAVKVRNTAGVIYSYFAGAPDVIRKRLEEVGIQFNDRPTKDIFRDICNFITPVPNDLEDSLVNIALQETFADVAADPNIDLSRLDSFNEELLQRLIGGLMKHYIFDKLILQSEQTALKKCTSTTKLRELEKNIKYYIDGIVDSIIPKLVRTGMNPSDFNRALEALCDVSYKQMEELQ